MAQIVEFSECVSRVDLVGGAGAMPHFFVICHRSVALQQQTRHAELKAAAAAQFACALADVQICANPGAAPSLLVMGRPARASLSGRDRLLLIGLADAPVGVDLEAIDPVREPPWGILRPDERAMLEALPEIGARHRAFLQLWTAKEAILKALGVGLSRSPESVAVDCDAEGDLRATVDGVSLNIVMSAGGLVASGDAQFLWRGVVLG